MADEVDLLLQRARALVIGVRPGIAWSLGASTVGVDLLDANGLAGWRIGFGHLHAELGRRPSDSPLIADLARWVDAELLAERSRWMTSDALAHHLAAVSADPAFGDAIDASAELLMAWDRNLRWGTACVKQGSMVVSLRSVPYLVDAERALRRITAAESCADLVLEFLRRSSSARTRGPFRPLVLDESRGLVERLLSLGPGGGLL